jgi:hypothetical protein
MPVLYNPIDRRSFVSQPQLTSWNHRYRGPHESYKTNAEMSQLLYDVRKIYEHLKASRTKFDLQIDTLLDGGTFVPTVSVVGLDDLADRLDRLSRRILTLEREAAH